MNYKLIFKLIGNILRIEALFMLVPLIVSFIYRDDDIAAFLLSSIAVFAIGTLLSLLTPAEKKFRNKDAFAATALSWFVFSIAGALPFYLSGCFESFVDCIFESTSGFTTMGATILRDIESLPRGVVFWRSFSHWIGGMGVLVFILAVMPQMNASSINLLKAESTGPSPNKIVPRIKETAKVMYMMYFAITVLLVVLLLMTGLPLYDTFIHAFSVAGTGGFSNMNASVGAYNDLPAEIVMTIFMFLFGVSFTLYYYLTKKNFKSLFKDEELWLYLVVVISATVIITVNITEMYGSVWTALRYSTFHVSSIISTTGFSTVDFNTWPDLSRFVLIFLMLTGCCAGSTGGGIKLVRILLFFKAVNIELNKIIHPRSVKALMINKKKTDSEVVTKVTMFFFIYFAIFFISVLLITTMGGDLITNTTAVISALSNVGPGFNVVGPASNFAMYDPFSKIVLSFCMIAGRLEFFPVLILFKPSIWRSED